MPLNRRITLLIIFILGTALTFWLISRYPVLDSKAALSRVGAFEDKLTHQAHFHVPDDATLTTRRELREETGYRAGTFKSLGILHTSNCFTDEVAHVFYATDLKPGTDDQDGTEQIITWRLPFKEAWQMAVDGKITDSLTLVALFRLQAKGIFK